MAQAYHLKFVNSTQKEYHFGVYQKFPNAPGVGDIAWQVRPMSKNGFNFVDWTMEYEVAVVQDEDGTYKPETSLPTTLGKAYEVKLVQGDILQIASSKDSVGKEEIKLKNGTNKKWPLGFLVSGSLIYVDNVDGGETANYEVHPTYYVAGFTDVRQGSLVDTDVEVSPVKVEFLNDFNTAKIECVNDGGKIIFKPPVYSKT